jgi:hypothetical protein
MGKFLLGIVVAALLATGLYFVYVYWALGHDSEAQNSQQGIKVQVGAGATDKKYIPPSAVMEDGTI